jgi:CubicO group peptidase (beta-lactamase class C family)
MELTSLPLRHSFVARLDVLRLFCWMLTVAPLAQSAPLVEPLHKMTDDQIVQDLRSTLDRLAAQDKFSGAVLVAKGGKILFEHAYGYADHAFNDLNKVDTKFNLASMGKMFTGVAVLQLVEQGKLSLDAKLIDVLPDYPNKDIANKVTIRQLLNHTSGMGDYFGPEFFGSSMAKFDTVESLVPLFVDKPLRFEPGTSWSYSNAGFIVLGLVIQKVSGESYYDYVLDHIFKPAGMVNSGYLPWNADVPNRASGYTAMGAPPGSPRISNIFVLHRGAPHGGGYSTVEDLFRFAQALEGHKLLNKEYTDLDMTGTVAVNNGIGKYALGMEEYFVNGVRIVGHSGGAAGMDNNLDMYPGLGYTVVVLTNYDEGARSAYQRLQIEFSGQELPKAIHLSPEALKSLAGKYQPAPPSGAPPAIMRMPPMELTADRDGLSIPLRGQTHKFLPLSSDQFFDEDIPNARINFTKDEKGRITDARMVGIFGPTVKATRLP